MEDDELDTNETLVRVASDDMVRAIANASVSPPVWMLRVNAALDASLRMAKEIRDLRTWRDAIHNEAMLIGLSPEGAPSDVLHKIVCWYTKVEIDPAVSESARTLRDTYLAEVEDLRARLAEREAAKPTAYAVLMSGDGPLLFFDKKYALLCTEDETKIIPLYASPTPASTGKGAE